MRKDTEHLESAKRKGNCVLSVDIATGAIIGLLPDTECMIRDNSIGNEIRVMTVGDYEFITQNNRDHKQRIITVADMYAAADPVLDKFLNLGNYEEVYFDSAV